MRTATDKQRAILGFVPDFFTSHGYPPTLREIGAHFGLRSTNGVNDHLLALERKGYIERDDNIARGLRLTEKGACFS